MWSILPDRGRFAWLKAVVRMVQSWWSVDRIRVSPREGRLLRLNRDDLIRIADQGYTIRDRVVSSEPPEPTVTYLCDSQNHTALLEVRPTSARDTPELVRWCPGGSDALPCTLEPDDIEVFERRASC